MKDDLRYTPLDCFETFPLPSALLDAGAYDPEQASQRQALDCIGERYHQFRTDLMMSNNEGLTSTYNRFHDPAETSESILELRRLHDEMDQAVLAAYGWSDALPAASDTPQHQPLQLRPRLPRYRRRLPPAPHRQERIASGELFFYTASEACSIQAQLHRYGAVKPSKKPHWHHRWPDDNRDDVLASLLALNTARFLEEQAMGLDGKGSKSGRRGATSTKDQATLKKSLHL